MPVSLAYPGNVQLSEARPSVSPDSATSARYSYGGHEGLSAALSALREAWFCFGRRRRVKQLSSPKPQRRRSFGT